MNKIALLLMFLSTISMAEWFEYDGGYVNPSSRNYVDQVRRIEEQNKYNREMMRNEIRIQEDLDEEELRRELMIRMLLK